MIHWQWQVFFHSPGDVFRRRLDAKTRKCRVDFFAIGARLRHDSGIDALNPILEVAWGRKEDNRATPKKCKHTGEAKRVVFNRFWVKLKPASR